jgi:hypothetical protein
METAHEGNLKEAGARQVVRVGPDLKVREGEGVEVGGSRLEDKRPENVSPKEKGRCGSSALRR